ncbi:MAG: MoaD/ThiS family protein [Gemmatimonadetes bacterium]|nr:MoaD/ThiS family protein [Gemmatimonadota bacterium]
MTMRIRLLFFALYRDLSGTDALEIDVPTGSTAAQAVERARRAGTGFSRLPPNPAIAVNLAVASSDTVLHEGDELALLPPVAGG